MKSSPLSPREERFCQEYLVDLIGSKAARRAGVAERGAKVWASRALTKANVQRRIRKLMHERALRTQATADEVLLELKKLAFADVRRVFTKDGALKSIRSMPKDVSATIASVEVEELFEGRGENREHVGSVHKLKQWDKLKALELLGKNLKLWTDKVDVSGNLTLEDLVLASRNPPKEKP